MKIFPNPFKSAHNTLSKHDRKKTGIHLHHRLIVILPWWILSPGTGIVLLWSIRHIPAGTDKWVPVTAGILAGVIMDRWLRHRRWKQTLSTLEHELTHSIVALLFFRKITEINAGRHGGHIRHQGHFGGQIGNIYISLAPYYLPTFSLILAFIRPFVRPHTLPAIDVLIGISLIYHTLSTIRETRANWPNIAGKSSDIAKTGLWTSALTIIPLTLLLHSFILYNLVSNRGASRFIQTIFRETYHFWL